MGLALRHLPPHHPAATIGACAATFSPSWTVRPPTRSSCDGGDLAIWLIDDWAGEVRNVAPEEHDDLRWCGPAQWPGLALANGMTAALLERLLLG